MKKILFVDDEAQILKTIGRIFTDSDYVVKFAESAEAALQVMRHEQIDLIVTDMRMPGMDGIELFKIIRKSYPDTIRIILSGYSDKDEILSTLRSNLAKAYIFKPWDNDYLINIVKQNLDDDGTNLPQEIITYLNNVEKFPSPSNRYHNFLDSVNEIKELGEIAAEIEKDMTVTAKLLQLVNAAYYGVKTDSVKKALFSLGTQGLENLVLSLETIDYNTFKSAEKIWNHAFYTSRIQRIIQEQFLCKQDSHANITAGLLHQIGVVFMLQYYQDSYNSVLNSCFATKEMYLSEAETEHYSFSHKDLSVYLLKSWNAPASLIEVAAFYDTPFDEQITDNELVCTLHLAQHYASVYLNENSLCRFKPQAFEKLGIDKTIFEEQYIILLEKENKCQSNQIS